MTPFNLNRISGLFSPDIRALGRDALVAKLLADFGEQLLSGAHAPWTTPVTITIASADARAEVSFLYGRTHALDSIRITSTSAEAMNLWLAFLIAHGQAGVRVELVSDPGTPLSPQVQFLFQPSHSAA